MQLRTDDCIWTDMLFLHSSIWTWRHFLYLVAQPPVEASPVLPHLHSIYARIEVSVVSMVGSCNTDCSKASLLLLFYELTVQHLFNLTLPAAMLMHNQQRTVCSSSKML